MNNNKENIKDWIGVVLFWGVIILLGIGWYNYSYDMPLSNDLTKYVANELKSNDQIILKLEDATINNPKNPESITTVISIDGKAKMLMLDFEDNLAVRRPSQSDAAFYLNEKIDINYTASSKIEKSKESKYTQYIVITEVDDISVFDVFRINYKAYKCELYLDNVSFGENSGNKGRLDGTLPIGN